MAANGQLPGSELAPIAAGQLTKDAAAAWNAMNVESRRRYGVELRPAGSASSYRTLSQQWFFWNLYQSGKGNLAAYPGTSNHGWGKAVDLQTTTMRDIVASIGGRYGWKKVEAPSEWWHWNYVGGYTGRDPGPDGTGGKPKWWSKVKRGLKAARHKYAHKRKRRRHSEKRAVRRRLHEQLTRLRKWIKWAADRLRKNDGWKR